MYFVAARHRASISLHRACDYGAPNIAYGCTEFAITVHRASIPSILLHRACDHEGPHTACL